MSPTPPPPFHGWSWRWLAPPEQNLPDQDALVRRGAARIALALSRGGTVVNASRSKLDVDLFDAVTEKRHRTNPKYSTCGDLVMAVLALLGCRDEAILNRSDDNVDGVRDDVNKEPVAWWDVRGTKPWKMGWNIALLHQGAKKLGAWRTTGIPHMGDLFLVGYGTGLEHVGVLASEPLSLGGNRYLVDTVEAGQVDEGGQCVRVFSNYLNANDAGGPMLQRMNHPSRKVDGWADITAIPLSCPSLLPPECSAWGVEPKE